jgi:hypothetical protein
LTIDTSTVDKEISDVTSEIKTNGMTIGAAFTNLGNNIKATVMSVFSNFNIESNNNLNIIRDNAKQFVDIESEKWNAVKIVSEDATTSMINNSNTMMTQSIGQLNTWYATLQRIQLGLSSVASVTGASSSWEGGQQRLQEFLDARNYAGTMPQMAKGGIVTSPTIAQIGESGPEAVIPLNKSKDFGGDKTYNQYVTINVNNPKISSDIDIRKLADEISRLNNREFRRMSI